jgi:hypothetical protein
MKKTLLLLLLTSYNLLTAQVIIYDTTHVGTTGVELSSTANGPATSMGDAIVLAGTARYLTSITTEMFNLTDVSPFTVTMSLYTNCPSVTGAGACGSGVGTLIPGSTVTVTVTSPPATPGTVFNVVFPFNELNLNSETDNTITVMINASRNNVLWVLGETPTIGSMPAGETGFGFATRCGSTGTNNGCARNFGINNNFAMTIQANLTLAIQDFTENNFKIYPNPVNNLLFIENPLTNKVVFTLTDLNGRIIKEVEFTSSYFELNTSDLHKGVYIAQFVTEKGNFAKKIIKE